MSLPTPPHILTAKQAFLQQCQEQGVDPASGLAALEMAAQCYHRTTQVSTTDQHRQERNQTQAELERVSSELVQLRKQNVQLNLDLTRLQALPQEHRKKAYKARKYLRQIQECAGDEQMLPATKVKKIQAIAARAIELSDVDKNENALPAK
jgi:vacuolar-type H+-ATPase subunit I/STV1